MMEFYRRRTPRARIRHKCEMCGEEIAAGEVYSCETGKYDGDIFTRKLHLVCYETLYDVLSDAGENEFDWDNILDWWRDNKCYECASCYPHCEPDNDCPSHHTDCPSKTVHGTCRDGDLCDIMDKRCWCTRFKAAPKAEEVQP